MIAPALDPGELGDITSVARRYAIALVVAASLGLNSPTTSFGIGFVLALAAYAKATHLVHDRAVRRHCHALMAMWTVAAGAAGWDLATGTKADGPLVLGLVADGTITVFGTWCLSAVVDRTDPPAGVRRWTTVGQTSAVALFGMACWAAGALAPGEEMAVESTAGTLVAAFVFLPALLGLVLGYGSAIGQLMLATRHTPAPPRSRTSGSSP